MCIICIFYFIIAGAEFTSDDKMKDSGLRFFFKQMKGIMYKKLLSSKSNIVLTFSQLIMLSILICLSHLSRTNPIDNNFVLEDNIIFDLKAFGVTSVTYAAENNLGKTYASLLREEDVQKLKTNDRKNFVNYFVRKSKEDKIRYKSKFIIAALFENSQKITAYYNAAALHSSVISLNYVYNTLLCHELEEEDMILHIWNDPLPSKDSDSKYVSI